MAKKTVTFQVGRSAISGRFITVTQAQQRAPNAVVETIKRPR